MRLQDVNYIFVIIALLASALIYTQHLDLKKEVELNQDITWDVYFTLNDDMRQHMCVEHKDYKACNFLNRQYKLLKLKDEYQYSPGHMPNIIHVNPNLKKRDEK